MISLVHATVRSGRVSALVVVDNPVQRYSTPAFAAALSKEFPQLADHTCRNSVGPTFGDVMAHTPLPHVVEHLVIQLQVLEDARSLASGTACRAPIYTGTTKWVNESEGRALVEVSFADDLVCLRAFSRACEVVNRLLEGE